MQLLLDRHHGIEPLVLRQEVIPKADMQRHLVRGVRLQLVFTPQPLRQTQPKRLRGGAERLSSLEIPKQRDPSGSRISDQECLSLVIAEAVMHDQAALTGPVKAHQMQPLAQPRTRFGRIGTKPGTSLAKGDPAQSSPGRAEQQGVEPQSGARLTHQTLCIGLLDQLVANPPLQKELQGDGQGSSKLFDQFGPLLGHHGEAVVAQHVGPPGSPKLRSPVGISHEPLQVERGLPPRVGH